MIICFILAVILTIGMIVLMVQDFDADSFMFGLLLIIMINLVLVAPFVVLDKSSGATVGTITSVDKDFFGTTSVYVKTSETEQEQYCVEDYEVVLQAKELIDQKVKISYGERVGLYGFGRCKSAPIEKIEKMEE